MHGHARVLQQRKMDICVLLKRLGASSWAGRRGFSALAVAVAAAAAVAQAPVALAVALGSRWRRRWRGRGAKEGLDGAEGLEGEPAAHEEWWWKRKGGTL